MTHPWSVPWRGQRSHSARSLSVQRSTRSTGPIKTINAALTEWTTKAARVEITEACVKVGPINHWKAHWSYRMREFSVQARWFVQFAAFYPHVSTQMNLARMLAVVVGWSTTDSNAASTAVNLTCTHYLVTHHCWANRRNISDKLSSPVFGPLIHRLVANFRLGHIIGYTVLLVRPKCKII